MTFISLIKRQIIKHKSKKSIKICIIYFAALLILLQLLIVVSTRWKVKKGRTSVNLQYVVVHIDLKGTPPTIEYLTSLLPTLKDYGVNAILLEYEDMFPYEGRILNLSAMYCYSKEELQYFLTEAYNTGIEIIPLVQTFGHMEFALKLQDFMHLREEEDSFTSICPSQSESTELIHDMLEQVITFHNNIVPLTHIHVGCDEVFSINKCQHCRMRKTSDTRIFLSHLQEVNRIVRTFSATTTILIWDDMLRGTKNTMKNFTLPTDLKNIETVYWDYKTNLLLSHVSLFVYHHTFRNIWVASAFKGADSSDSILPNINKRFLNHYKWLTQITNYKFGGENRVYNFKGIILTGWSRYSHMDPLCELLPVSLPSLILNLMLIKTFKEGIENTDLHNMESCEFFNKYLRVKFDRLFKSNSYNCLFETNEIYKKFNAHFDLSTYNTILHNIERDKFETQFKILSSRHLKKKINHINIALGQLSAAKRFIEMYMSEYYDKDIINDYVNEKIYSIQMPIIENLKMLESYSKLRFWGPRPYNYTEQ